MIRALSLVLLGAASFAAVYWALEPREPEAAAPATVGALPSSAAAAIAPVPTETMTFELRPGAELQIAEGDAEANPIRDVTPENMTAAPALSGPLVRVEQSAAEPVEAPREARTARLFSPVVTSAGTIQAGDREIRLAGIVATEPDKRCGEGAKEWPCGRVARAALRSFIRGRAIECEIQAGADAIPDPARCLVGGDDIAAWLVAQGWAEGRDTDTAGKAARASKLGLFSEIRPDAQTDDVAARR